MSKMHPLIALHRVRMQWIKSLSTISSKKILDVGCGSGILSEELAQNGGIVVAFDKSATKINQARSHANQKNLPIQYIHAWIEQFQTEEKFDMICCMEFLEHVSNPWHCMKKFKYWLKPNGNLFIATINRNYHSLFLVIVMAEHILRILPKGTHRYEQFIMPSECISWALNNRLTLKNMTGVRYQPSNNNAFLTYSMRVNYMLHFNANQ